MTSDFFDKIGVCSFEGYDVEMERWRQWVDAGNAAELRYMMERKRPDELLPNAHSAIVCLMNYYTPEDGMVARYARGRDYHYIMWEQLHRLAHSLGLSEYMVCCDAMPILERALAVKAGLGWIGRNNMLINPELGSFTFIGVILALEKLEELVKLVRLERLDSHCGNCRKCIEACPTHALGDHSLDCRRCLSYRTIESRELLTVDEARHGVVFGCDRCQEVCPWNKRFAHPHCHPELQTAEVNIPELTHSKIKGTALSRAPLSKIKQNYELCISSLQNS